MLHSKKETEKLISDIKKISELIIIDDKKLEKKRKRLFKKIKKDGIESILKKEGDSCEDDE